MYGKKEWRDDNKSGNYYTKVLLYIGYNKNKLYRYKEKDYVAYSNYGSWSLSSRIEFGYQYKLEEETVFVPYISSEYSMLFAKGCNEEGAGALNMRVKGNKNQE
ncbi:MAG: autotransporter domain-containing protein [Rickettsiales endosymbiont of Dermacentor nuttalli]